MATGYAGAGTLSEEVDVIVHQDTRQYLCRESLFELLPKPQSRRSGFESADSGFCPGREVVNRMVFFPHHEGEASAFFVPVSLEHGKDSIIEVKIARNG